MSNRGSGGRDALVALGLLAVGSFVWASVIERNAFTLRRVTAPVLEPGSAPLRILHISDLHLAPWQKEKQAWIRALADLQPDLVINTGDNLGHAKALDAVEYAFEPFLGIPGVFVNGSNDYFGPQFKNPFKYFAGPTSGEHPAARLDTARLQSLFIDGLGWANLNNAAATIMLGSTRLDFMGVDDPHRHFDSLASMTRALDDVRSGDFFELGLELGLEPTRGAKDPGAAVPSETAPAATIGVAHAPYQRILNAFVNNGADMIFAGHTHGGQVCLPGFGALVTNCDIPRSQVKGLSTWRNGRNTAMLNVSAGVGTSIYAPVRFACAPEVSLVTLTARVS
ncbi:metallophosphoesterase [Alpinimonas psychrophila]|uniref:Putative MPP superfamily phosphohydrolase n=1 Tax=Alpinimonas psychrophila TaxID=748908 RepID=A0A7W3PPZ4_9MICO|nr:metallophosphoesterase [Alpinimonas psychrophila]MBA8829758.1 putative MPP superfamily phosphohydrolase [Alpinimonas psychrophila]